MFYFHLIAGVRCEPEPVDNGIYSGGHLFGDIVTYSCISGYSISAGDQTRQCLANQTWSGVAPTCSSKGTWSWVAPACSSKGTWSGVAPTCASKGTWSGVAPACSSKGTWSGVAPACSYKGTWSGAAPTCSSKDKMVRGSTYMFK